MRKRKGQFEGHTYFLSPFSVDECIRKLNELVSIDDILLVTEHHSSDFAKFKIELREPGAAKVIGEGQLRRWQGTETRIDCDIKVDEGVLTWLMFLNGFFIMVMVFLPMIILVVAETDYKAWGLISGLFLVALITLMLLVQRNMPLDDTPRNLRAMLEDTLS